MLFIGANCIAGSDRKKITIDGNKPCLVLVTKSVRWTLYFKGTTSKELIADQKESYNLL